MSQREANAGIIKKFNERQLLGQAASTRMPSSLNKEDAETEALGGLPISRNFASRKQHYSRLIASKV